jgi:stage III sporulation protein SpoIIIAA
MIATEPRADEPAQIRIDDLGLLFAVLPERLRQPLESEDPSTLLEVILDFGRAPEAR